MKMVATLRRLARFAPLSPMLALALLLGADPAGAQASRGQVTFVNATSFPLDFEVDGRPVCPSTVRPGFTCTTQQAPGPHELVAKGPQNWVRTDSILLEAGANHTWTVAEDEEPGALRSPGLDRGDGGMGVIALEGPWREWGHSRVGDRTRYSLRAHTRDRHPERGPLRIRIPPEANSA